jgi:hypothetical protein
MTSAGLVPKDETLTFQPTIMSAIHRTIFTAAALVASLSVAPCVSAQDNITSVEIALLPQFCWAQLNVPDAKGDDFRIRDCGPAANHYCSALIYIIRAKHTGQKQSRLDLLGHADVDVKYTEKAIADYPKCNIREHVGSSRAELNNLMNIYGFNRPRAR